MTFSIVIAVYQGRPTLEKAFKSIFEQSCSDWELIVIDGGSDDGTVDLLKENTAKIKYWISEPDTGIYNAWNKALPHIHGEWVIFLGADDFLMDSKVLENSTSALEKAFPEYRVVYGQVTQVDQQGEIIRVLGDPWEAIREKMKSYMKIPHTATFQHRSLFDDHGGFCEDFKIAGDYEFLLRELADRPALFMQDLVVSAMQVGGVSASPQNNIKMVREYQRARHMHGFNSFSLYYPLSYLKNEFRLLLWQVFGEANAKKILDSWRKVTGREPYWTRL